MTGLLIQDDGVKVALGERYGFRVNGPGKLPGADFLVGGSSIVFNVDLVEYIMDPRYKLYHFGP